MSVFLLAVLLLIGAAVVLSAAHWILDNHAGEFMWFGLYMVTGLTGVMLLLASCAIFAIATFKALPWLIQ